MIDFAHLENYKENNRLEAKEAQGGLPRSIWETYSAFANTNGGVILLGVRERKDNSFEVMHLINAAQIIKDFWNIINNQSKVNINLLSDKDVYIENVEGKDIIVIEVPQADRNYRPIYINNNPITGTYRRNGDGDYRCTQEEYQAMVRDAAAKSQDMLILQEMSTDAFNKESVRSYRQRMRLSRPGHVWETLEDEEFLLRIGAVAIAKDGQKHPTSAGLLMFGNEYEIVREFNNYFLDYQEHYDETTRWTDRVISSAGDWSGNVYDFYFKVYNKLIQDIKVPFKMDGGSRVDDTPLHQALREALANCLINADYYGRQGIVVNKYKDKITFANPGRFRIEIDAAKSGGISDPRNSTMLKMFTLIDIGERAGSGIPNIFAVCKNQGWSEPIFIENTEPDRVILELYLQKIGDKKSAIKIGDKKSAINEETKQKIMEYFEKHGEAKTSELAIGLKSSRTRDYIKELVEEGKLIAVGEKKGRIYKLNKQ